MVICSTDKIAHTASIECIHWYRMVCLKRLRSAAFIKTIFPNMQEKSSLQEFALGQLTQLTNQPFFLAWLSSISEFLTLWLIDGSQVLVLT